MKANRPYRGNSDGAAYRHTAAYCLVKMPNAQPAKVLLRVALSCSKLAGPHRIHHRKDVLSEAEKIVRAAIAEDETSGNEREPDTNGNNLGALCHQTGCYFGADRTAFGAGAGEPAGVTAAGSTRNY
jgi:hypothetical protein